MVVPRIIAAGTQQNLSIYLLQNLLGTRVFSSQTYKETSGKLMAPDGVNCPKLMHIKCSTKALTEIKKISQMYKIFRHFDQNY